MYNKYRSYLNRFKLEEIKKIAKKCDVKLPILTVTKESAIKFLIEKNEVVAYITKEMENEEQKNILDNQGNPIEDPNKLNQAVEENKEPIIINTIETKCLNNHDNFELLCKTCKMIPVCDKCKNTNHESHEIINFISSKEEEITQHLLESINKEIESKEIEHKKKKDSFEVEIEEFYNTQILNIGNQFRELHDLLHFREVELKRELKSYHDENQETYTTIISKIESDIQKNYELINNIKSKIQNELERKEPVDNGDSKKFLKTIIHDNQNLQLEQLNLNGGYKKFKSVSDIGLKNLKESFLYLNLVKEKKRNVNHLLRFNAFRGVEKIHFRLGQAETVVSELSVNSPNKPNGGYIFQSTFAGNTMYIFDENNYYELDTGADVPEWKTGDLIVNSNNSYCPTSIYDGKDHIYMVGGYQNGKDSINTVYQFNIHTKVCVLAGTLDTNTRWHGVTYDQGKIHVIGGFNLYEQYLNRIDIFDVVTGKNVNVVENLDKFGITQIKQGCYIPSISTYYIFTRDCKFFKLNPKTMIVTKLLTPFPPDLSKVIYDLKLCYDGNHDIYMIMNREKSIYKFHILKEKWKIFPDIFKESPTNSDDYFQFISNINK